ncbi:MAG: hypothetical protein KDB04_13240 [Acidimicrobiales bacterium]|nr:hypothetical protein [Acidimicrobiales bacterium]HRW36825.1 hypothetical protein [Aquihabitans sp.]
MGRDRFFFLHLQKTAGTTVLRRLRPAFADERAVYPAAGDGPVPENVLMVDHLLARWQARGDEVQVVTGHFPLCTTELLGGPWRTFTVLRDPVERTLSYLRHHRALTPADAEVPLEEIYDDPFRFEGLIHNHMVKMLALRPDEMVAGAMTRVTFGPEHLARAVDALEAIEVIGVQDQLEAFCDALTARFGWALGPPQFSNRTRAEPVPESFRRRIAADSALDVELWDHARRLLAERGPSPR